MQENRKENGEKIYPFLKSISFLCETGLKRVVQT